MKMQKEFMKKFKRFHLYTKIHLQEWQFML